MNKETEFIIKEYPYSTRWMEGRETIGIGNLILTSTRLTFLNRVELSDQQIERIQELSAKATTSRLIDYALTLHKMNFQIPLSSVTWVKMGLHSLLPLPRLCLRIFYLGRNKEEELSFIFNIPLIKGIYQWEIIMVWHWVTVINRALRHWQLTYG